LLAELRLPADARERIEIALAMVDAIEARIAPLERELRQLARRQAGCRALMGRECPRICVGMSELERHAHEEEPRQDRDRGDAGPRRR
jgi:hypothetical protein